MLRTTAKQALSPNAARLVTAARGCCHFASAADSSSLPAPTHPSIPPQCAASINPQKNGHHSSTTRLVDDAEDACRRQSVDPACP